MVKIVIDRKIPDNACFISCTVSKNRAGQYFVSVLVETESRCGWKNKDLKLSDRTFVCKDCGLEIDRDLNAAINIQAVGVDAAIRTQSSRVAGYVEASKME